MPGAGRRYPPSQRPILPVVQKLGSRRGPNPRFHVDARFSTVIAPRREARHPVDRVHGSSVPRGEFRRFPHDLAMKLTDQQRPAEAPATQGMMNVREVLAVGAWPSHRRPNSRSIHAPSATPLATAGIPTPIRSKKGHSGFTSALQWRAGTYTTGWPRHRPPLVLEFLIFLRIRHLSDVSVRLLSALRWPAYESPVDGARPGGHGREAL